MSAPISGAMVEGKLNPTTSWKCDLGEESLTFLICKMGMVIPSRDSKVWAQGRSQSYYLAIIGFPDSSVDKESTCNAGHPSSIPGSGRSAGEGISYPLQYSWASLMAQLVKNPLAMWETWVCSPVGKIPWKRLPTPVFWPGEFHGLYSPWVAKSQTRLSDLHFHFSCYLSGSVLLLLHAVPHSKHPKHQATGRSQVCQTNFT